MKKSVKRFLCGTLSVMMASTLVAEQVLRLHANSAPSQTTVASVAFKDVTGQFDTSAIREANFNDKVQKVEDVAPTYETRTVMVTLSGDCLADSADGMPVKDFVNTFTGNYVKGEIRKEQNDFLKRLSKSGISYTTERTYDTLLNAVAIEVDTSFVADIKAMQGVESVVITTAYAEPQTAEQSVDIHSLTNLTSVYETGIYNTDNYTDLEGNTNDLGEGTVVAILDTGLDYTHSAFQRIPENYAWTEDIVEEKLAKMSLTAKEHTNGLNVHDVYVSAKVPFAYDYADKDADVYPSFSNHGTHVAGIIGGYDPAGYTDKDGNAITDKEFRGVVPDSQLVICKVFTDDLDDKDLGGAEAVDIVDALEDCVLLGVDVINMSLGTSCGFSTTDDGDDEGEMLNAVYDKIKQEGISLVCAASNDFSSAYGGAFGTNKKGNPDSSTVGSPSTFSSALSVASINGQKASYFVGNGGTDKESYVFFEESRDENGNAYEFVEQMLKINPTGKFEYVVVSGTGAQSDYPKLFTDSNASLQRIALVKRGDSTFQEKVTIAQRMGAIAIIVYNNVSGVIRMNLGEIDNPIPAISIDMESGTKLVDSATNKVGTIQIGTDLKAGPFMSEFSSWGPTHDLRLKPEITAHGGEITSTVPGGYGEQSGTSMASPNMAGVMAIIRNYIKGNADILAYYDAQYKTLSGAEKTEWETRYVTVEGGNVTGLKAVMINRLANQLIMSTATTVRDTSGLPYSPRKQGAGLGSLDKVVSKTQAFLSVDSAENDYRPKLELGDDPAKTGVIDQTRTKFSVTNFGTTPLSFTTDYLFFTETLSVDKLAVAEKAYMLDDVAAEWYVNGNKMTENAFTVAPGATVEISVTLQLSPNELEYMQVFDNGMYLEGFLKLVPTEDCNASQCELTLPFLAFHGDWELAPMLDYDAYTIAENEADPSVKDEDKIKASVWETQPYSIYYNETYILPMGSFVYLVDENDDPVYTDMDYNAISRYNEYYGEGNAENYLTTTGIKALYAGLLRNARVVKYKLINEQTGEVIHTDKLTRVGKAYSGGGNGVPANVEFELYPEEKGLMGNGLYRMDFEFYMNDPDKTDGNGNLLYGVYGDDPATAEIENATNSVNRYSFTFTVDYEAPVLEDVRVRYYNRKVDNKTVQDIYLDIDVFDNHYPQALLLCYPKKMANSDQLSLQLATEYATPIRKPNKNGTTTVSIDITDIYEKYGNQFYLQIDDYAVNTCLYQIDINAANAGVLPEGADFALAKGEDKLELDIYETHKVNLVHSTSADLSNFSWSSSNPAVAGVKNGEIVGLAEGTATITVSNRKDMKHDKTIQVTVSKDKASLVNAPNISFGAIKTAGDSLQKAQDFVEVNSGKTFNLSIEKDPWYHPMTGMTVKYESSQPTIASVDEQGTVKTWKKGSTTVTATLYQNGKPTFYIASVTLMVQDEFDSANYILNRYNGIGYNDENGVLWIPDDRNIMTIGAEAFKDNDNVKKIVIPASVTEIKERAFENCTALEEIYFVDTKHRVTVGENNQEVTDSSIDWADLSVIYEQAFLGCKKLKKIDFSNVKKITLAREAFKDCTALTEIIALDKVGTLYHQAFMNCKSLKSVDLTGTFVAGDQVFANCTALTEIKTGKYTAIGKAMFQNCTGLRTPLTLYTGKIGDSAFVDCKNLTGVCFASASDETLNVDIGANAFVNCSNSANVAEFIFGVGENVRIRTIGANAFANDHTTKITITDAFDLNALKKAGLAFANIEVSLAEDYAGDKYAYDATTGTLFNQAKTKILFVNGSVTGAYTVPAGVTEIGDYAFANTQITSVAFTAGTALAKLGEGAFYQSKVQSVQFADVATAFTEIPAYAFYKTAISSITLPETVTKLGAYAFASSAITSFKASGLTVVGDYAFAECGNIHEVAVENAGSVQTGVLLAPTVEQIGNYVFSGCNNLLTASLPTLTDTNEVTALGEGVFYNAQSLTAVTFGAGTNTTGNYTFIGTAITEFTFQATQTKIGTGLFAGSNVLTGITLAPATAIVGDSAFRGCTKLATVTNLNGVERIGDWAFYNTALTALDLRQATHVGHWAFASAKDGTYTQITMQAVEYIGSFAFRNGGESTVDLPATLQEVGGGAFASSKNLVGFKTAGGAFVAMDTDANGYGVLYRILDATKNTYELVCYPANRVQAKGEDGKKMYTVKEGTLYVLADAFIDLNQATEENPASGLDKVVLTHAVNAIGANAFIHTGIQEYVFESIQAPALEQEYLPEVMAKIQAYVDENASESVYRGYYYTNFEQSFVDLTRFGNKTSTLTMYYPVNGLGYNNHVYSLYFPTRTQTTIMQTDATRDCIAQIESFDLALLQSWAEDAFSATDAGNKALVLDYIARVETARENYNVVVKDKTQTQFIQSKESALKAVEDALKPLKVKFGVQAKFKRLKVDYVNSTFKDTYNLGDTVTLADLAGLKVLVEYEDGTTREADFTKLTIASSYNRPLVATDDKILLSYADGEVEGTVNLYITVNTGLTSEEPPAPTKKGCGSAIGGVSVAIVGLALGAVLLRKKEN